MAFSRVLGPLIWSTVSSLGTQLLAFVTFALLARLLGPQTFGLVALAALVIDLLQVVSAAGINEAVIQRPNLTDEDADTAFWANLASGLFFFLLVLVLAPVIAHFYHQPALQPLISALSFTFLLTPVGAIHTARLTRELQFRSVAMRNLAAAVAGAAVGLPLAFAGYGAWALVGQRVATAAAMAIVAWMALPWRPRFRFNGKVFREFIGFGGYLSASQLLTQLNIRAAELVSGLLVGTVAVAVIRAGSRVMEVLNQLTFTPFHQISMPIQARAQHDAAARNEAYMELSRLSAFIMFPAFLGCFAVAGPLVTMIFGDRWAPTADAIRIFSFAVIASQMNNLIVSSLTAAGRTRVVLGWSSGQMALGIFVTILAAPFGWRAMLIASVVRAYLLLPIGMLLLRHYSAISPARVLASIRPATLSALVMAGAVHFGIHAMQGGASPLLLLIVGPAIGALIYLALYLAQDRLIIGRVRALLDTRRKRPAIAAAEDEAAEMDAAIIPSGMP